MNIIFKKVIIGVVVVGFVVPTSVGALDMPVEYQVPVVGMEDVTARSYMVIEKNTGKEIVSKNKTAAWPPASMTKLVTAMVVLDMNPKLTKVVTMSAGDEVGGSRISAKAGIKYTLKDLLYATLMPSANNAANAIARSTGLSREEFVVKMNEKAKALGATNTAFVEPSGISEFNVTTAEDFSKIAAAAFSNSQIQKIATTQKYTIYSTNNKKYVTVLKNTNKLLTESNFYVKGGKTGYIDESGYNFTTQLKDFDGKEIILVILGSKSSVAEFQDTKKLALWSWLNYKF